MNVSSSVSVSWFVEIEPVPLVALALTMMGAAVPALPLGGVLLLGALLLWRGALRAHRRDGGHA